MYIKLKYAIDIVVSLFSIENTENIDLAYKNISLKHSLDTAN